MKIDLNKITAECNGCRSGACCTDGVELSKQEMARIQAFNPNLKKPWFRKTPKIHESAPGFEYETRIRQGRCVFLSSDRLCAIYPVRPSNCREFPLEDGEIAEFYKLLCDKAPKFINSKNKRGLV
ncbi:MAG: YkgJ family cysteine cluster protein [Candidatus Omnitrophica bacterium]|nr:YkgJ family cysteine cluster protein [Candidatus Omnitrophota bacterium]